MAVKCAHGVSLVRAPPLQYSISINMAGHRHNLFSFLAFLTIVFSLFMVSLGASDAEILLKFKNSLTNTSALDNSWNDKTIPCKGDVANWKGAICVNGSLWGLQLENMGLSGKIDVETLKDLPDLRTLSIKNNMFEGPLPDFKKDGAMRAIYLTNNKFSGEIPGDSFEGMSKLKKVYLEGNEFTGSIPSSLASLPKLMELRLERNRFTGKIPDFKQQLDTFNVSGNDLEGPIPASLSKFDASSFSDNEGLCGQPLKKCGSVSNSNSSGSDSNRNSKNSKKSLVAIVVLVVVLAAIGIIGAAIVLHHKRNASPSQMSIESPPPQPSNFQKKAGFVESTHGPSGNCSPEHSSRNGKTHEGPKLCFVRDDRERFDLPDLLKASAEILGSGCFGSSYKAALPSGTMMVVKRFKQMNNVGKEDFQEHMRRLGRLSNPNLLSLVAYYYRKEEKLLVSDFVHNGSLAVHLHGHQSLGQPGLDWPTRLKIVKGVAKGLAYLYKELPSIVAAHGHLKSSNVLLGESYEPLLSDYGLVPVINQEDAQDLMVAYKSPEYSQHGRITKKTDVWSLGVLILEVISGKFPANFLQKGKGSDEDDLATWVNSIPQEQWTTVVFDKEIGSTKGSEGEMLKLMKIGLSCCEGDVEKRLDLKEAVEKIDDVKERDGDDEFFSSYTSEGDLKSSRGMSDDFNFSS